MHVYQLDQEIIYLLKKVLSEHRVIMDALPKHGDLVINNLPLVQKWRCYLVPIIGIAFLLMVNGKVMKNCKKITLLFLKHVWNILSYLYTIKNFLM